MPNRTTEDTRVPDIHRGFASLNDRRYENRTMNGATQQTINSSTKAGTKIKTQLLNISRQKSLYLIK